MKDWQKLTLLVVVIASIVGLTFMLKPEPPPPFRGELIPTNEEIRHQPIILKDYIRYPGEDDRTALELLQAQTVVESQTFDFGVFVEAINGERPPEGSFWKLYINGQPSTVGADQLVTERGDIVEWRMEQIEE